MIAAGEGENERAVFIQNAIDEHKSSAMYKTAADAKLYASGRNATIDNYQKLLYTLTGKAVPDTYTSNHKCKSGFFRLFVTQEAAYQVGNGVTFTDDKSDKIKGLLGKDIDAGLYKGVKSALVQAVSFGFFNLDHVEFYELTEFVPLWDEDNGSLGAGIRFWQISPDKPLRATLFELDGYTEYAKKKGSDTFAVLEEKRDYKQIVEKSEVGGMTISNGGNYPGFPVVPLWGNMEHQSEIVGRREQIDCYDLIKSGFANDLEDASMLYWTLENCGGMGDIDLAKFVEHMKTVRAAAINGDGDGAKATAHTIEVPYQSRQTYLQMLRNDLYDDFMALDVKQIAAGNVTATQIQAAYEPLNEKCDELEMCLNDFFTALLALSGTEAVPKFTRSQISNQTEVTQMILSCTEYLDDQTILDLLPFIPDDMIDTILQRKAAEELTRFKLDDGNDDTGDDDDGEGDDNE